MCKAICCRESVKGNMGSRFHFEPMILTSSFLLRKLTARAEVTVPFSVRDLALSYCSVEMAGNRGPNVVVF